MTRPSKRNKKITNNNPYDNGEEGHERVEVAQGFGELTTLIEKEAQDPEEGKEKVAINPSTALRTSRISE